MAISDDIKTARKYGVVHCGLLEQPNVEMIALIRAFNRTAELLNYREVDEATARASVSRLLHREAAYDSENMPEAQAINLTERFLAQFGEESKFFTNNWCVTTEATFDEGVLVLGSQRSGYFWVEDED